MVHPTVHLLMVVEEVVMTEMLSVMDHKWLFKMNSEKFTFLSESQFGSNTTMWEHLCENVTFEPSGVKITTAGFHHSWHTPV